MEGDKWGDDEILDKPLYVIRHLTSCSMGSNFSGAIINYLGPI